MKILFLSGWGSAVPLAMHCQEDGHETKFWIQDKDSKDVGDGFVNKVDDYKSSVGWADLVICDDTHFGKINDEIRSKGTPVVGGTKMTDALEEDRGMGQRLFEACGLSILDSFEFKTVEEAISHIDENPKKYVVKISGTGQNDKSTTYVGQCDDGADIIPVLEHMADNMEGVKGIEIQECVEGVECALSGFFNGEDFAEPLQLNFEHKKLMSGPTQAGIGPNTGEMGTSAIWVGKEIPLYGKLLKPFIKPLQKMGYHGDFDINCIVHEGVLYPLEMTNRFGWPTLPLQIETMKDNDLGQLFFDLATGKLKDFDVTYRTSLCVVIGVPPLPYMNDEIFEKYSKDMPVLFKDEQREGIYPGEAKYEDDQWHVAGSSGCLAVCTGGGDSIEECQTKAYDLSDNVIVPNKMVRDDIGDLTDDAMDQLEEEGFI